MCHVTIIILHEIVACILNNYGAYAEKYGHMCGACSSTIYQTTWVRTVHLLNKQPLYIHLYMHSTDP